MMNVETLFLTRHSWVPNNPRLPVLLYHDAIGSVADSATEFEGRFARHGWTGIWRNGIFDYHHYHTGAHEVLGIAAVSARVVIGGPGGAELDIQVGDCLLLPAGTGHCLLKGDENFLVIGAYPPGQDADIQTAAPSAQDLERISNLPLPETDPVEGQEGALMQHWRPA